MATGLIRRTIVAALIMVPAVVLSAVLTVVSHSRPVVITEKTLPEQIRNWESREVPLTDDELAILHSPAASQRIYFDSETGSQVQVLVLQVNNTQNAHDPKLCMAGSGYSLAKDVVMNSPWGGYPISRAEFARGQNRVAMYYWLQTPNGTVPDLSAGLKLEGIRQALRGSLVRGISVRVIALPNSIVSDQPTDPKLAEELWGEISREIDLKGLLARM